MMTRRLSCSPARRAVGGALCVLTMSVLLSTAPADAVRAEPVRVDAATVASIVDPLVRAALSAEGIPGAGIVFVSGGRVLYVRGYGVEDAAARKPVVAARTVWPIASVTKLFTATAAMQLVERGRIDLDTDLNEYFEALEVPAASYRPLTLRHLLTHTTGLDELPGRQFDGAAPAPDLTRFLGSRLVRRRAPGELTAYSSYGIALAGALIEQVSGQPYAVYLRERILAPLGMRSSRVMRQRGDEQGIAQGYEVADGKAEPVAHEWYVTTSTSSLAATLEDMGRFIAFQLRPDGRRDVLSPQRVREMQRQQATNHPAVPGWGFGFQIDRANDRDIAEHGGDIAGFASLLVLVPAEDSGFFIVHHGEGGDLRFRVKRALLDGLFPATTRRTPPAPRAADSARLREYAGNYRSSFACFTCRGEEGASFEVRVEEGALSLWGTRWVPLETDLFVSDDGARLLGFSRDARGPIASVTGGSWRVAERIQAP